MFLTDNASIQEVLFFPQMRPEKAVPQIELGEDEHAILDILKSGEQFPLSEVKEKSKLSGKKWDKASKTLTKNNIVKVEKIDENLLIKLA
jgi:lysyl-tRNA synthetase class 2